MIQVKCLELSFKLLELFRGLNEIENIVESYDLKLSLSMEIFYSFERFLKVRLCDILFQRDV